MYLVKRFAFICLLAISIAVPSYLLCRNGFGGGTPSSFDMSERLLVAVRDGKAGKSFFDSPLSQGTISKAEMKAAKIYVCQHPDISSYILLMALRKHAPDTYLTIQEAIRAKVFSDAIEKLVFLNDFGYLDTMDSYDGPAAKALLEVGDQAIVCLQGVLINRQEAPIFGSRGATASYRLKFRRADFAYRYIMLILNREPTFMADVAGRDKLIANLEKNLECASSG